MLFFHTASGPLAVQLAMHTDYNLSGSIGEVANTSVKNICAAVEKLSQAGAKYFMIVGSMDLKVLPAVVGAGQVQLAQEFQSSVNHQLAIKVEALEQDLRISIEFFNPIDVTSKIQNDPAMYGISNLTSPCQPTWPEVKPSCGNPDAYYMWDEWHISLRVNQWLGKAMVEELVD